MKILVLGANGFLGSAVSDKLSYKHHVIKATRGVPKTSNEVQIDLSDKSSVVSVLRLSKPEVIVNCAGVVYSGENTELNLVFTQNLLEAVVETGLKPKRVIISGSAGEYGVVDKLPVSETDPVRAESGYGLNKAKEVSFALDFAHKNDLSVVVARIFNPIGPGMHPKFLTSGIIRQINEIKNGNSQQIEVSRLDTRRDYINVKDLADAFCFLIESHAKYEVYNIGSGKSVSTAHLIDMLLDGFKIIPKPKLVETTNSPEPLVAVQADISRMRNEFGWSPKYTIEETIKEIIDAEQ